MLYVNERFIAEVINWKMKMEQDINTIQYRMFVLLAIVGNGHILQWDLMSKINILQS